MASISNLKKITDVAGVKQYILIDSTGKIIAHDMDSHLLISSMILSCLTICKTIDKNQFRHLIFRQKDNCDLFLFPIGKFYLGVIKESDYDATRLPNNIYNFMLALNNKG